MATRPAIIETGLAAKVPPWGTAGALPRELNTSMTSALPPMAPIGKPPPMIFPAVTRSGSSPKRAEAP
ncbi:hypothetical protein D3C72_2440140 [compost metagenome]